MPGNAALTELAVFHWVRFWSLPSHRNRDVHCNASWRLLYASARVSGHERRLHHGENVEDG